MLLVAACATDSIETTTPPAPVETTATGGETTTTATGGETTTAPSETATTSAADTTVATSGRPQAPDFTLELGEGGAYTLSEGARPVYMVFWAEW